MRNSVKNSVHQSIVSRAVVAALLIGATIAIAFSFKAAGQQQSSQQANQQAAQPAPTPRPAITMASPEDAAREMNNPRSKWFREAKFGLFIHWAFTRFPPGRGRGSRYRASANGS